MADFESHLSRWLAAGILDDDVAGRIRAYEHTQLRPSGLRWQGIVALTLGAILLAGGVVLFVQAHWDDLGALARYFLVLSMVAAFHLAGALFRSNYRALSTTLHVVGTISTGAAIALVGQIFHIEEHWPAAILMWAIAALAGWALINDQVHRTLTLLLFPAWLISEWTYSIDRFSGGEVYIGRMLVVWAALYFTFFLYSPHRTVRRILIVVATLATVVGTVLMLEGWRMGWRQGQFLPWSSIIWGWLLIAAIPLLAALLRRWLSLVPVAVAILYALALPWCQSLFHPLYAKGTTYTTSEPNLLAHALVTGFSVFYCWVGLRKISRALVNIGIIGFAISVAWFYLSDLYDKFGRSLGLIGLGILFLFGGWLLERTRRKLITRVDTQIASQEAE